MNTNQNQLRLIEILNYLWSYTDPENFATISDIQEHLKKYNVSADRKTIVKDIDAINHIEWIDVEIIKSNQNRYFIKKRFLAEEDIKILCDAIRSSYFISDTNGKKLITVLKQFVGPSQKKGAVKKWFNKAILSQPLFRFIRGIHI